MCRSRPVAKSAYRAFSLTWPVAMLISHHKRKNLHENEGQVRYTNMTAVTSCENALLTQKWIGPKVGNSFGSLVNQQANLIIGRACTKKWKVNARVVFMGKWEIGKHWCHHQASELTICLGCLWISSSSFMCFSLLLTFFSLPVPSFSTRK